MNDDLRMQNTAAFAKQAMAKIQASMDAGKSFVTAAKEAGLFSSAWITDREPSESGFYWVVSNDSDEAEPWQFDREGYRGRGLWYAIGDEVNRCHAHSVRAWCGPIVPPGLPVGLPPRK